MASSVEDQVHRVLQAENLLTPTGLGILTLITTPSASALLRRPRSPGLEIWMTSEDLNLGCFANYWCWNFEWRYKLST